MLQVVFKKVLIPAFGPQQISVPWGAEILSAREQYEEVVIWFRCTSDNPNENRSMYLCGTGHPVPEKEDARYIGTAMLQTGALVIHVFEMVPA